jgi:hypothetical protein
VQCITNAATALKLRLTTSVDVPRYAIRHMMCLLHPKLDYMLTLQSKADLVDAVREIVTTDGGTDTSFLNPEFKDILQNADRYQKQLKQRGRVLEYMTGVATDAFVDAHKFAGVDFASRITELASLLQLYHAKKDAILTFMETGSLPHGFSAGR